MDAEIIPFPRKDEAILNTLESPQECFALAEAIDDQIALWRSQAHAPSMRTRILATFIVEDCQPLGRAPKDYREDVVFGGDLTLRDAISRTKYEQRRALLSDWTRNEALDTVTPINQRYGEYIENIVNLGQSTSAPQHFKTATHAVQRLFLLREQLTLKIGPTKPFDTAAFADVMNRLMTEIY